MSSDLETIAEVLAPAMSMNAGSTTSDVPTATEESQAWTDPTVFRTTVTPFPAVEVLPKKQRKKVAIVGFASSSRHLAPYDDDDFAIWTMNHAPITFCPKWHVLFEMHTLDHLRSMAAHSADPQQYFEFLKKQDPAESTIYMQQQHDIIPASVQLPREAVNAWFANYGTDLINEITNPEWNAAVYSGEDQELFEYLIKRLRDRGKPLADGYYAHDYYTSTISWMLAIAIVQGAKEIHLYGIDLLQDEEYFYQRAGAEYLIGFARGMGIKVYVPNQSALCKANYTYGFTEPLGTSTEGSQIALLVDFFADKVRGSDEAVTKARQDAHTYHGALQMADLVLLALEKGVTKNDKNEEVLITEPPLEFLKKKRKDMAGSFNKSNEVLISLGGQEQAFKTTETWIKHWARGGVLKS